MELTAPVGTESWVVFDPFGWLAETGTPPELLVPMGTAGSEALGSPAPMDANIAAVTDRVKIFEAKLGFGTDAFTSRDFKGAVFLRLGDPTDIFLISRSALNSLKSATTLISLSNSFIKRSLVSAT